MGTNFNYDDTSHQVIFDQINGGSGSQPLQLGSQDWTKLGNEIGETGKSFVQKVMSTILANRQGAAADASAAAVGAMLPWMDDVTQIAHASAQRTQEQAEYWVTARNNVPPVPPTPKSVGFFSDPGEWAAEKMDWFPGVTSDEEKAQQLQQNAAEQARQAMRTYQASSNPNVDAAPAFTAPQALDGSVGSLPLSTPNAYGAATAAPMAGASGPPAHLMAAHQAAAHQPAAIAPAAHQPAAQAPVATVSQLAQGGHGAPAPGGITSPGNWGSTGTLGANQGMIPSALAVGTGIEGEAGTRRASARGESAGAHVAGAGGARHAGFGPRPSTEFGPRPTTGSHPSLDGMSGTRSIPSTRGTGAGAGGYGQPLAGSTGQRGEPDREHRSKYLLQDDSSSIVGDLPPTAPPVIGADY